MELFKKKPKQNAEPQAPVALAEKPEKAPKEKKQSIATMDVKDLLKMAKNKPAKKGTINPKKRTMNFVHHKSNFNMMKVLPVVLVIGISAAVFVKIGFLDQLDKKTLAYSQLAAKQEQLAMANARLTGYDEIAHEYGRYSYGWMSESEVNLVDRIDILELVEEKIAPTATVENIAINNNVLTMNLHGITLEETSKMVQVLESSDMVDRATVYSASAADDGKASIFISITLVKPVEAAKEGE